MNILYLIIAVFVLAANVQWYRMKFILRARGYPISYFSHWQDLGHFRMLIAKESNAELREHYSRIQTALYVSVGMMFFLFMTIPVWQIAAL